MSASAKPPANKFPVPVPTGRGPGSQYLQRLGRFLELTLSLPERSARALGALVGGTTLVLGNTVMPGSVRGSTSYRFTVGMLQTFLLRNVAGMDDLTTQAPEVAFLQRKMLGASLEAAGLLTMHFSPVWVFALASDTARGGQVFFSRLIHFLKAHQVIPTDHDPRSIEQLLEAIQDMAERGAAAFDMPPLSRGDLQQLLAELRHLSSVLANRSAALLPSFESLWNQILEVANAEKMSVEEVMGILAINAGKGRQTAEALGKTSAALLDELLLEEYRSTLEDIRRTGAINYLRWNMEPFFTNALSHFDFRRPSRTEHWYRRLLSGLSTISRRNRN